jgi:2-oxoglutarate ferredoxin oxidoreductase subunit beta
LEPKPRHFVLEDYEGAVPRWCTGCGGHAILTLVQRLCRDEQLEPENTVFVSGIGCSSRFPHYMKTYGFHGLHGRALPVACGIRARRPDLKVFVATGDGDCCAIGTSHWFHAVRYNMDMTVMMFNNTTYGLTKMQTSPTTPKGDFTLTHPHGALLTPLNPLEAVLGITNASFAARTVDWNNPHMFETLKIAYQHPGFSFIEIIQRCPHYKPKIWDHIQDHPENIVSLTHEKGIKGEGIVAKAFPNMVEHDPTDLNAARELVGYEDGKTAIGILYQNKNRERYDEMSTAGLGMSDQEKLDAIESELDRTMI